MNFTDFDLSEGILEAVDAMGFSTATPIQSEAIPIILEGKDLIACAQTGTGKTGAFLIPVLDALAQSSKDDKIKVLIIVPTRELAIQIDQQLQGLAYFLDVTSLAIYGGNDKEGWDKQKAAITNGADILIATPGRILSHMALGYVDFTSVDFFILDEADRMMDMGFHEDIIKIFKDVSPEAQRLMFSATMPPNIRKLSEAMLNEPEQINIAVSKPAENILQAAYMVYEKQKIGLVKSLLIGKEELKSVIIFLSSKKSAAELEYELKSGDMNARAIHSDLDQKEREQVMLDFRNRKIQILVATDIVSRGIDVDEIALVINYEVPKDPEDYIHRIGRTARAEASGVALTFITEKDQHSFARIERMIEMEIHKAPLPLELGEGPEYNPKAKKYSKRNNYKKRKPTDKGKSRSYNKRKNSKNGNGAKKAGNNAQAT